MHVRQRSFLPRCINAAKPHDMEAASNRVFFLSTCRVPGELLTNRNRVQVQGARRKWTDRQSWNVVVLIGSGTSKRPPPSPLWEPSMHAAVLLQAELATSSCFSFASPSPPDLVAPATATPTITSTCTSCLPNPPLGTQHTKTKPPSHGRPRGINTPLSSVSFFNERNPLAFLDFNLKDELFCGPPCRRRLPAPANWCGLTTRPPSRALGL